MLSGATADGNLTCGTISTHLNVISKDGVYFRHTLFQDTYFAEEPLSSGMDWDTGLLNRLQILGQVIRL